MLGMQGLEAFWVQILPQTAVLGLVEALCSLPIGAQAQAALWLWLGALVVQRWENPGLPASPLALAFVEHRAARPPEHPHVVPPRI